LDPVKNKKHENKKNRRDGQFKKTKQTSAKRKEEKKTVALSQPQFAIL